MSAALMLTAGCWQSAAMKDVENEELRDFGGKVNEHVDGPLLTSASVALGCILMKDSLYFTEKSLFC